LKVSLIKSKPLSFAETGRKTGCSPRRQAANNIKTRRNLDNLHM
jgi:hypothetical protein